MDNFLLSYMNTQQLLYLNKSFLTESDTESSLKKSKSDCESKITTLDNIKVKLMRSNDSYLELYKHKAQQTNPTGLMISEYKYGDIDEVSKKLKQVLTMISQKEKAAKQIKDIPKIKRWIEENISNNGIFTEIQNIFFGKNKKDLSAYIIIEKSHQITKSDIRLATATLENINTVIDDMKKMYLDLRIEYATKIQSYDSGVRSGILNSSLDDYYETITANCIALRKLATDRAYKLSMKILKQNMRSARLILAKAANYNPRNIKESALLQDQLNTLYEINNFTENDEDDL